MVNNNKTEDKIQQEIIIYFRNKYCLNFHKPRYSIFSVPNGGSRNKAEAIKLKATGLLSGVSDLIIVAKEVYFIEVKTSVGVQSPKQKDFKKVVEDLDYKYYLVRSLEDFKKIKIK